MYMNTAVINIKTDVRVKTQAKKIASELGFSLSALINGYLNQLIKTKVVHFSALDETPSEYMIQALRESENDRRKGDYRSFKTFDEALDFVDKIINDSKKS